MNDTLLKMIKLKCHITWNDENTNQRITEIAEESMVEIRKKLGIPGETEDIFLKPGKVRELYKAYCMYAWNDMTDQFDTNYKHDILHARREYEVQAREAKAGKDVQ